METEAQLAERLGAAIRRARAARGWSQATLAEKLDLSVTYVGMLERGEKLASLAVLIQLAGVVGASVASLTGAPAPEPWVEEAVTLLRAVPDAMRDTVLGMLRAAAATAPAPKQDATRAAGRRSSRRARQ